VDSACDEYRTILGSIVSGIDAYTRRLPTESGQLELVYFRNLVWDGANLAEQDKPFPSRDFGTFEKYRGFLAASLASIAANMAASERGHCYEMLGTLSSGYDSTTTAALCRPLGMEKAISFRTARGGHADHGGEVAEILGLQLAYVDRHEWRRRELSEVAYLAATGAGTDTIFEGAADLVRGSLLVTGFHGDKVWAKETTSLGPDIVRGDWSGLSFCERRLTLGCIHLPIPFMGVRQIRDINALSNSRELSAWDVPGDYSRPICRRIVEEAGVPRRLFGVSKKAVTTLFRWGESQLSDKTLAEYYRWLKNNTALRRRGPARRSRTPSKFLIILRDRFYLFFKLARMVTLPLPDRAKAWVDQRLVVVQRDLIQRIHLMDFIFPWAIERWSRIYARERDRA
jgi:hypothetical protein